MNNLTLRIISAIVLIVSFIFLYFLFKENGIIYFAIVFTFFGILEFRDLGKRSINVPSVIPNAYLMFAFILLSQVVVVNKIPQTSFVLSLLGFVSLSIWATKSKVKTTELQNSLCYYFLGLIYSVVFPSFVIMTISEFGAKWFLMLAVIVPATDIFAYIGGKTMGKHKLMPEISPKKTLEGAFSGLLGACFFALICNYFFIGVSSITYIIVTTIVTSFLSQTGDLFVSLLKRVAGVKDSGNVIPGHGGVLDRVDGFYMAAPFLYITASYSHLI